MQGKILIFLSYIVAVIAFGLYIVAVISFGAWTKITSLPPKEATPVRATDIHAGQICVEGRLYNVVKQPGRKYFNITQSFTVNQQGITAIPCEEGKTDD